jgi:hypothetical protein
MDGDRRRHGEQRQKPLVLLREAAYPPPFDQRKDADNSVLLDERHMDSGRLSPLLHELAGERTQVRVVQSILPNDPVENHRSVRRLSAEKDAYASTHFLAHPGTPRPDGHGEELVSLGKVLVELALPDVQRLGRTAGDVYENIVRGGSLHGRSSVVARAKPLSAVCTQR